MNGPLSPEEIERARAYYNGTPGQNMSDAGAPAPDPQAVAAAYYGPPAPPAPPAPAAPSNDFGLNLGAVKPVVLPGATAQALVEASPPPMPIAPKGKSPAPPAVTGPTARDDAEFDAFKSRLAAKPVVRTPVGGGGPKNDDPFGMKKAIRKELDSYDQEKAAVQAGADAEKVKGVVLADKRAEFARMQEEDAAVGRAEQDQAAAEVDAQMTEIRQQLADLKTKKIDPGRFLSSNDTKAMALVGGILGGLYQGFNRMERNPFMDSLDRMIDRDIAAQEKNLAAEREGIADQLNMLGQQRAMLKDTTAAKLQYRNMAYEAVKEKIAAEADRLGVPAAQARADQATAQITREQAKIERALAERLAAQANAGMARSEAFRKEMRDTYMGVYEKGLASGLAPEQAEQEATRMVQNLYGGGAPDRPAAGPQRNPVMSAPKDLRNEAAKEYGAAATAEKGVQSIKDEFGKWRKTGVTSPRQMDAIKSGIAGAFKGALGPGMSSDKDFEVFIEPNLPKVGDSEETLRMKEENIASIIRSKTATPILDSSAPGWRGPEKVKRNPVVK